MGSAVRAKRPIPRVPWPAFLPRGGQWGVGGGKGGWRRVGLSCERRHVCVSEEGASLGSP